VTAAQATGEAIRLAGTITQVVHAPQRWRTKLGGTIHAAGAPGEVIVDVAGRAVTVEVTGTALCDDGPAEKCSWGEAVTKSGDRFKAHEAPVFTPVSLATATLAVGAQVEIYGEVLARSFADDGGMREAPSTTIDRVRALLVCSGSGAASRLATAIERTYPPASRTAPPSRAADKRARKGDPRTQEPGSPQFRYEPAVIIHWWFWVAATALAMLVATVRSDRAALVLGLTCAVGVVLFRPMPPVRPFRALEKRFGGARHPTEGWWVSAVAVFLFCTIIAWLSLPSPAPGYVGLGMIAVAAIAGGLGAVTYARRREMLRAPRWTGEIGVYAALEGVVRDPTPVRIGNADAAIASGTGYDQAIGSSPDKVVWQRFHGVGTFLIETSAGVVEVSPQHAVWATTVQDRVKTNVDGADYELVEIIPVGGRVLATGWIERGTGAGPVTLQARGTRPALLVATGPAGEPRDWIARLARARVLTAIGLAVIGGALSWELWLR
jgi:hypothetical protein